MSLESRMAQAVALPGADYIEVRIEESSVTRIHFIGPEIEQLGETTELGGCVRACKNGGWGFSSFNDLSQLMDQARAAIDMAGRVGKDKTHLASVEPINSESRINLDHDPRNISLDDKFLLCQGYNDILMSGDKIQTSIVRYEDRTKSKYFSSSEGSLSYQEEISCGLHLAAIAGEGSTVQRATWSDKNLSGFEVAEGKAEIAEETTRRATEMLSAPRVKAGTYTVIIDPLLCGVFAHEAFGHLSEADFIYENERMRETMHLGRRFGPPQLNIVDDASLPQAGGSYAFDDEGLPGRKNYLITAGVLTGRLHNRETAMRMEEEPTGNARALTHEFAPIVRMSNTFIEPGPFSFEQMVGETEQGLYVKGALGGMTNCEMFTFSAEEAFEIKDGKVGGRVRDIVLSGNVFETLQNIDRIGNDLEIHSSLGGCGKNGQGPLRVSIGGPHIRIQKVVIGGD